MKTRARLVRDCNRTSRRSNGTNISAQLECDIRTRPEAHTWAMAKPRSPIATGRYWRTGRRVGTHRQVPSQCSPCGTHPIVVGEPSTPARSAERFEMGGETEGDPNHRRWCRPTQMDTLRSRRMSDGGMRKPRGIMMERGGRGYSPTTRQRYQINPEVEDGCPSTAL